MRWNFSKKYNENYINEQLIEIKEKSWWEEVYEMFRYYEEEHIRRITFHVYYWHSII